VGGGLLSRSRALAACAMLALGAAGCTAAGSNAPTLSGKTLRIYVSAPASLSADPEAQDVVDAERLAFQQLKGQVTAYQVNLTVLTHNKLSDNARQAIGDTGHAIAYLGEVLPGDSADTIGITNAQGLLQVSPTDTAVELTQKTPAVPDAPKRYYESFGTYGQTFARVVPTTKVEATALIDEMRSLGVHSLYVSDDGSEYGRAVALAVRNAAAPGITVVSSGASADAAFFGSRSATAATSAFERVVAGNPKLKLFAPSALDDDAFAAALPAAVSRNLYVSAPGLLPKQLASAAPTFVSGFRAAYGHAPAAEAIFGYEAMSAVLHVIQSQGSSANDRSKVAKGFLAIRNRSSPLGTYSIDTNGDTSLGASAFVIERVKASKLVASKAIPTG
jgi:branched-chain amino acid transport system substrate-binding protein